MAERKWGAITSGATFESLATSIVFFEYPKASLFGRRGKDGGQDARSGDGTLVFQAKHHENGSAPAAIRDAKSEAKKIEEYRQPDSSRYAQWRGVTNWRLVTNAAFNPTDKQRWDAEVVPLFAKLGLGADYWEREDLNALLDKHPEIHRSFFVNETRTFLSLPEARERLPDQEPFLRRDDLGPFCGREVEISKIRDFLASSFRFLVIHGAGGMGKTRLLAEAGERIASEGEWQVLWANVASMATTGAWFEAIVPERATLLLVDEPPDEVVLQQLAEQLGGRVGRTAQWRVAIAVRSPKDPVLRFLRGARMRPRVQELPVEALPSSEAEEMCAELLKTGALSALPEEKRRDAARYLSKQFSRHPVWLTLVVQHLEDRGDLRRVPVDAATLADEYLWEIEQSQSDVSPESVRNLLRWVALIGSVNQQDDATIKMIGDVTGIGTVPDVGQRLASLVRRRALIERGAHKRFIELRPDVLRDHVLRRWLSTEVGGIRSVVASNDARALLDSVREAALSGELSGLWRSILVSLARTEFTFRLSGNGIPLLAGFFEAIEASVPTMSASRRLGLVEALEPIAWFRPRATASLSRAMREAPVSGETVEGIFGPRSLGHDDVILTLPWLLFHGAMGAELPEDREAILRELCVLAEVEAELAPRLTRGLPNDGKRAAALITRVLEGGTQFQCDYDDAAMQLSNDLIGVLMGRPPTRGEVALLDALVQPLLAIERRQIWADDRSFTWRTYAISPESSAWFRREKVFAYVKTALSADATPIESRVQLWRVFAENHRNINRLCSGLAVGRESDRYYALLAEDLRWTYDLLAKRCAGLEELAAAREVWDWHKRFGKDPKLKEVAVKLETLYATNGLAKEFEPLLDLDDWEQQERQSSAKAAELALAASPEEITGFLERAVSFLGEERELSSLSSVAQSLGGYAEVHEVVRLFVKSCLEQPTVMPRSDFGVTTAVRWVSVVRRGDRPVRTHVLVRDLLAQCGSNDQRANLLRRIYGPRQIGGLTAEEHVLLRGSRALFASTGREVEFIAAIAQTIHHDWPALRPLLEDALSSVAPARQAEAVRALVAGISVAVQAENAPKPPSDLAEWLMARLSVLPDLDELGDSEWKLSEILKRVGRVDVRWLPAALARRSEEEAMAGSERKWRAISHHGRISQYVRGLTAADSADVGVIAAVEGVLAFVGDNGSTGYYLPEVLQDIDPEGLVAADVVAARVRNATGPEDVRRLARLGGAYAINSAPWRTIALATIRAGIRYGQDVLRSIYGALGDGGVRTWSGAVGEVPAIFSAAVNEARSSLAAEVEGDLMSFWQHRVSIAEAELHEEEQRAKEERGE